MVKLAEIYGEKCLNLNGIVFLVSIFMKQTMVAKDSSPVYENQVF